MATLVSQVISRAGVKPTYAACAGGGDKFATTGVEFIHIKNASVGSITLSIAANILVDTLAVAARTVVIPAGEERMIGPFSASVYADAQGLVDLTYTGVTTLTIAVLTPGS